jgi:hypothetical protein
MSDVFPEIEINETPLSEIDPERLSADLMDGEGEITVKIDFAAHATVYACNACNIPVTAEGEPAGAYERDVQAERCTRHPDYDEHSDTDEDGETIPCPHVPTVAPLGWLDTVKVETDTGDDSVTVTIMVDGHPVIMSVARVNRTDATTDAKLMVDVPHPGRDYQSFTLHATTSGVAATGKYIISERQA